MFKPKFFILAITALMVSTTLFSQEKWSLERCIAYAKENNLQIKQQKLQEIGRAHV